MADKIVPKTHRELKLIAQYSPCDTNFFDTNLLAAQQRRDVGDERCAHYSLCKTHPAYCALQIGAQVAGYVAKGGDLKSELLEVSKELSDWGKYYASDDGKTFTEITGKTKALRAVEKFARVVLLEDPSQSVFPACEKCKGIKLEKTVTDSGRDGLFAFSGSGRTRKREISYCPNCDPTPTAGTFDERIEDNLF